MTGTPSTLSSLTLTTTYPLISIANGCSCSIKGVWIDQTYSLSYYTWCLYFHRFLTNLLSISTITRVFNCVAIFYLFLLCLSWTLYRSEDWFGHENGVGFICLCQTPLHLGFLPSCLGLLILFLFYGIADLAILVFLNLSKSYHGYLWLSLCLSLVKWANIIVWLTQFVTPFHPLVPSPWFTKTFGAPPKALLHWAIFVT